MKIVKRDLQDTKENLYGNKMNTQTLLGAGVVEINRKIEIIKKKLIHAELVRLELPYPVDAIEYTYERNGITEKEYKELETVRNEDDRKNDSEIFATLEKIIEKRDVRCIKTNSFINEIVKQYSSDIRFAYKNFSGKRLKNSSYNVYIHTILAIITASISAMTNIDFEAPTQIIAVKKNDELHLTFEMKTKAFENISKSSIIRIPRLEARIEFLCALCSLEGIQSGLRKTSESIEFEYIIKEIPSEAPILYAKDDEQMLIFRELVDIFNPVSSYEPDDEELEESYDL